jgi:hypothetical protein
LEDVVTHAYVCLNHRTLKFNEHAHHLKHRHARGRAGVETLRFQEQVDTRGKFAK